MAVLAGRSQRGTFHASGLRSPHGATPRSDLVRHDDDLAQAARAARRARARFAETAKFEPKAGRHLLLPAADGALAASCSAWKAPTSRTRTASARARCPACCRPAPIASPTRRTMRASRRSPSRSAATASRATARPTQGRRELELPEGVDGADLSRIAEGVALARDLINTPANDMGPAELEEAARDARVAAWREHRRRSSATTCSSENFPLIHAVGRAAAARAAPDRLHLGRSGAPEGHAGRQGRLLRHRRARHQAGQRDADHEEGHGRRRLRARAGAHDHGRAG